MGKEEGTTLQAAQDDAAGRERFGMIEREEEFHFIWQYRKFRPTHLKTASGMAVAVLEPGHRNLNAGPDFLNSMIRIGDTVWAGNVELHLRCAEWYTHHHHEDPAYDNVILHVVLQGDEDVLNSRGEAIPCLNLKEGVDADFIGNFRSWTTNGHRILCHEMIHEASDPLFRIWLSRLLVERLQDKVRRAHKMLDQANGDWDGLCYRLLGIYLGGPVNAAGFEQLSQAVPHSLIRKHARAPSDLEALLFGVGGMLAEVPRTGYPERLRRRFVYLQSLYGLSIVDRNIWKKQRMKPMGSPALRLSQWAMVMHREPRLFTRIMDCNSISELQEIFDVDPADYWTRHIAFGAGRRRSSGSMGLPTINRLIINLAAPVSFLHGRLTGNRTAEDRALQWLEQLPPENNLVTRLWRSAGRAAGDAGESQAMLELTTSYCDKKRCLSCSVGMQLLGR